MKGNMDERCVRIGEALVESGETVRQLAKRFGLSKSTVHKDLTERLPEIDLILAKKVRKVLDENKSTRHINGGVATRDKYRDIQKQRSITFGQEIMFYHATISELAYKHNLPRKNVCIAVTEVLPEVNPRMAEKVKKILERYQDEVYIRYRNAKLKKA